MYGAVSTNRLTPHGVPHSLSRVRVRALVFPKKCAVNGSTGETLSRSERSLSGLHRFGESRRPAAVRAASKR
ncbi:MAG: hypothetical protein ACI81R_003290 [Bradymonadia bacterium]